jgi:hypothetical protein
MDKAPMHTPGRWAVTKGKPRKITANGVVICNAVLRNMATTAQNKNGKGEDEAKANARLIAAAPELLQVANKAFDFLGGVDGAAEIRAELMAAIAKATGQGHFNG